jgi:DNA replication protein DnaC
MASEAKPRTLADVLREKQIVPDDQLEEALRYRADRRVSLDQALVELAMLSEDDLRAVYADAFQVRSLKLEDVEIDREAVCHVPAAVAREHHLIPVRRSGNTLAVAMADPADAEALAAVRRVTDFDIIPFAARYDAIEHAVFLHYGETANGEEDGGHRTAAHLPTGRLIDDDRVGHVGRSLPLHRDQTFETFVEDAANQFPLSVAKAISELQSEDGYNPFHCWGGEGCGKTHLLNAVASAVMSRAPLKRVILTTGQRFVDNLFECMRDRKLNFFRYLYREADLLLVDEAEALLTRDWAQRELVETIGHMQRNRRFVILAARGSLALESRTLPELRIALESGVIAGFSEYSSSAKQEILRRHAGAVDLRPEVLKLLADRCGSVRDLIGLVQQVVVMAVLGEREVTEYMAEELIEVCGVARDEDSRRRARELSAQVSNANPARRAEPASIGDERRTAVPSNDAER